MGITLEEQKIRAKQHRQDKKLVKGILIDKGFLQPKDFHNKNIVHKALENVVDGYKPSYKTICLFANFVRTNPDFNDFPILLSFLRRKKSNNKKNKSFYKNSDFYISSAWGSLRVKALLKYGRKCCLCGRTVKDGIVLHVDHIKPRSKYPKLGLDINNLQILCEDCNIGKSNHY